MLPDSNVRSILDQAGINMKVFQKQSVVSRELPGALYVLIKWGDRSQLLFVEQLMTEQINKKDLMLMMRGKQAQTSKFLMENYRVEPF